MARFMFIFALTVVIQTTLAKIQKVELAIHEGNANFKEKIFVDEAGRYGIVKVPKHNDVMALEVFVDYKMGYRIHKRSAEKLCLVMDLAKDEEKPQEILDGVKQVNGKFSESSYTITNEQILPVGKIGANSKMGKSAAQFCGKDYNIVKAVAYVGDDIDGFVTEHLRNSSTSNDQEDGEDGEKMLKDLMNISKVKKSSAISKRGVAIYIDLRVCPGKNQQALYEVQRCNGMMNHIEAKCKIQPSRSCIYLVNCTYSASRGLHMCIKRHNYHTLICCDYKCKL